MFGSGRGGAGRAGRPPLRNLVELSLKLSHRLDSLAPVAGSVSRGAADRGFADTGS
jgi:hypothetical protein